MKNKKILIVIPSANDHMIIETINRMIFQAKYPENLNIVFSTEYSDGVFESMFGGKTQEEALELIDTDKIGSIKHVIINPKFINGPSSTRNYLCKLKNDEEYFLSIDAHTSFGKNWDENLTNLYDSLLEKHEKPLISGWLNININQYITDDLDNRLRDRSVCNVFNSESGKQTCSSWNTRSYSRLVFDRFGFNFDISSNVVMPLSKVFKVNIKDEVLKYTKKQILCAQFMFTSTKWIDEVNFSNQYTFKYEEPDASARSYLAGYDILDFETQYLSNMSVASAKKDRSFTKYSDGHGYNHFVDFFFDAKNNEGNRKFKDWLREVGLVIVRGSQKNESKLDVDIKLINEIKNR